VSVTAVDICCGVGALSYGLRQAGVDVRLGVDTCERSQFAYECNVDAPYLREDVFDLSVEAVREKSGDEDARLVAACAPCQPFSEQNSKRARDRVHGEALLARIHEIARALRPEFLVFENVPSAARSTRVKAIRRDLTALGYNHRLDIVDAANFGAPQRRRRMVLFATRLPVDLSDLWRDSLADVTDVRSAVGDLPYLEAGARDDRDPFHVAAELRAINRERIRASAPGGTWADWPARLQLACHQRGSGTSFKEAYGRMKWDQPAPTITTKFYNYGSGRFGHPEQDRALSAREAARLQGFPDDFQFIDPATLPQLVVLGKLIGNAVPVPLARAIGTACRTFVEEPCPA